MLGWIGFQKEECIPKSYIEQISKDIVRLWLISYFDGPTACAFLQTCKRFTFKALFGNNPKLLWQFKTMPRDRIAEAEIHRAKQVENAIRRLKEQEGLAEQTRQQIQSLIDAPLCGRCGRVPCNCKPLKGTKQITCRCGASGPKRELRPWCYFNVGPQQCVKCGKQSTYNPRNIHYCIYCDFICAVCDGIVVKCDYCDSTFSHEKLLDHHMKSNHPGILDKLLKWWNQSPPTPHHPARRLRYLNNSRYKIRCAKNGYFYQ